ncbi:hypothetical protein AB1Y20_012386 [Prymnesium parvum]|uniref:cysteine desulfurase n=1 Tax=Prymnesium parvum TaxID=97485 RepID=A0AB34IPJ2_PRYPA
MPLLSLLAALAALETSAPPLRRVLGAGCRADFPILDQTLPSARRLTYLDSAATSHKPSSVIAAMRAHETRDNANVHRGAHTLSVRSTAAYEGARDKVAAFVNAAAREEIVFTRGATEAINLVAAAYGARLSAGDEVVLSVAEHHSNLVPWQLLAERRNLTLKYARLDEHECIDAAHLASLLSPRTKLVAFAHVSNTLGAVAPVEEIVAAAKRVGACVLIDACQSVPHMPVDVQRLGCDFLVASGHKMCGPTGIGFLYGRLELLQEMPPWQGGGEMIADVFLEGSTYAPPPSRFEAGTPPITQAVGLGAAIDYLSSFGMEEVERYEQQLGAYLYRRLSEVPGIRIYGPDPTTGRHRAALCSFNHESVHASDLATFLDQDGVAVRAGHHCTQPLHRELGAAGSARASLYVYNTMEEIDTFIDSLRATIDLFAELE